jgi:hypothetical protein
VAKNVFKVSFVEIFNMSGGHNMSVIVGHGIASPLTKLGSNKEF